MGALKKQKHNYLAELLYGNCNNNAEIEELQELYAYLNMLHSNIEETEFISIFNKKSKNRWGVNTSNWATLANLIGQADTYISVNSFYTPNKCTTAKTVRLNAVLVDLDYYNIKALQGLTAEQVIGLIRQEVDYLEPSFYMDSGNGLYMLWLLNNTYSTTKSRSYFKKIEETLIERFKDYGGDAKVKDPARVVRPPGTINSKTGRKAKIILPNALENNLLTFIPERFEMQDIASYFWGEKEEKVKKTIKNKQKTVKNTPIQLKNLLTLNYNRAMDLEMLVNIRGNIKFEGNRNQILFLYRLSLMYAGVEEKKSLELTLKLNSKFADPLPEAEVITNTISAVLNSEVFNRLRNKYKPEYGAFNTYLSNNGAYIYKTSTIIKILNITPEEQKEMLVLIAPSEKKRRKDNRNKKYYEDNKEYFKNYYQEKLKEEGKISKSDQNYEIRQKIKSLRQEGFKNKEIATRLNLTVKTLERHITYMKKNKLL